MRRFISIIVVLAVMGMATVAPAAGTSRIDDIEDQIITFIDDTEQWLVGLAPALYESNLGNETTIMFEAMGDFRTQTRIAFATSRGSVKCGAITESECIRIIERNNIFALVDYLYETTRDFHNIYNDVYGQGLLPSWAKRSVLFSYDGIDY